MNNISKIWFVNLALVAAVLFVYGGLSWFDSKDPEASGAKATENANVNFTQKLSNFFSLSDDKSNDAQSNNEKNDENVEYGFAEDGTKLRLDNQDYDDKEGIFAVTPEDHARLKTVEQDLALASNQLMAAIKPLNADPNSEKAKNVYENLQELVFELQQERDDLQEKMNSSQSKNDGL